jgi:hypothetical protein
MSASGTKEACARAADGGHLNDIFSTFFARRMRVDVSWMYIRVIGQHLRAILRCSSMHGAVGVSDETRAFVGEELSLTYADLQS